MILLLLGDSLHRMEQWIGQVGHWWLMVLPGHLRLSSQSVLGVGGHLVLPGWGQGWGIAVLSCLLG